MYVLNTIFIFFVSKSVAFDAAAYIDPDHYLQNIAPKQITRLESYLQEHHNALTLEQHRILNESIALISTANYANIPSLRVAAEEAFGLDEAAVVLTGAGRPGDGLERRTLRCDCSHVDSYCRYTCKWGQLYCGGCIVPNNEGCGTFWVARCDGLCSGAHGDCPIET